MVKEANSACQTVVRWHAPLLEGTRSNRSDAHKARDPCKTGHCLICFFPSYVTLLPPTLPPSSGHASVHFLMLFLAFSLTAPNTLSFSLPPLASTLSFIPVSLTRKLPSVPILTATRCSLPKLQLSRMLVPTSLPSYSYLSFFLFPQSPPFLYLSHKPSFLLPSL